ncbi:MAG: hypothetical protein ACOYNF_06665 [Rhodoferax sp.]
MDILGVLILLFLGLHVLNLRDQRVRIALLGAHLGRYQIEKLLESLMQGYLRALGESDLQRQSTIWSMLETAEATLCEQFNRFALEFSSIDPAQTRVSRLALALPYAARWWPGNSFDVRKVLSVHAHAMTQAASNSRQLAPKGKAFTMMAELLLMQHTCHWFCRSKLVASARLLARHKTPYVQVLASVTPETRQAYCALVVC